MTVFGLALGLVCGGCVRQSSQEVVVYAALDREFSEPLLKEFEAETGIRVLAKYDIESNKTVGLATAISSENARPRADVFWNNEILHSVRLAQNGLAAGYRSPQDSGYPAEFVAGDHTWHGFAARARVLIVNTELLPDTSTRPVSIRELADPRWKNNCGLARPLLGTTATHAAVLFHEWGAVQAEEFFSAVRDNAIIEGGNRTVAINVAQGRYAWGLTDTDDAVLEMEKGSPVTIVWPDQAVDGAGTMLIPNTLMIVRGGPNPDNARRLVDWLLRAETESKLAAAASAQIPLRKESVVTSRIWPSEHPPRIWRPDFAAAATDWDQTAATLSRIFQ